MKPVSLIPTEQQLQAETRRHFFQKCGVGVGAMALHHLLAQDGQAAHRVKLDPTNPMAPRTPQFSPRAKRIIYLFMAGGPSQLELFEDKPKLREVSGQPPPPSLLAGRR